MNTQHPAAVRVRSVWFPPPGADESPVIHGSTLPQWALTEIGRVYDPTGRPVRCFRLPQHEHLASPRPALANRPAPGQRACLTTAVALAEPDAIAAMDSELVLVQFLRRLRAVLTPGGILAIHTHADHGREHQDFADPGGRIVLAARKAGLLYLQHLVLVHDQPQTEPVPNPPADPGSEPAATGISRGRYRRPRPIHTDLYIFTSPEWTA